MDIGWGEVTSSNLWGRRLNNVTRTRKKHGANNCNNVLFQLLIVKSQFFQRRRVSCLSLHDKADKHLPTII
jgi:hypothetical protein